MLVRSPNLLVSWKGTRLSVKNLESGQRILGTPALVDLLDRFGEPAREKDVTSELEDFDGRSVETAIRRLRRLGFLLPAVQAARRTSHIDAWKQNLASVNYHVAARDLRYVQSETGINAFLRRRLSEERQPPKFKRYRRARSSRRLSRAPLPSAGDALRSILEARRTVREFARSAVPFEAFSEVVRGTWGKTGYLESGVLGRLTTKTSPSAGARHPIECYVLAWNVAALKPGLYHYDVPTDALRRLRSGNPRTEAVAAASRQGYVGRAAFLCIMTAVFERTLWKYPTENAYRVVWLDAGHLAQTFCLLATSLGLGPFQTAAIQDSYIEKLIGLDGIKEFPVYLCGAGVPAKTLL